MRRRTKIIGEYRQPGKDEDDGIGSGDKMVGMGTKYFTVSSATLSSLCPFIPTQNAKTETRVVGRNTHRERNCEKNPWRRGPVSGADSWGTGGRGAVLPTFTYGWARGTP